MFSSFIETIAGCSIGRNYEKISFFCSYQWVNKAEKKLAVCPFKKMIFFLKVRKGRSIIRLAVRKP